MNEPRFVQDQHAEQGFKMLFNESNSQQEDMPLATLP